MTRSNEYISKGGTFEKLSDAISSIDQLLQDVKRADEERGDVPKNLRTFRHVIAELQSEVDQCIAGLRKSFTELDLDPLYIYTTEEISVTSYTRHIKFLHPDYEHVWLTEGTNQNVASQLVPFINYGIEYEYPRQRITVTNLLMETRLNLPDFKTSLQAAHMNLEILKQDAQRVALVCENGEAAHKSLSQTLTAYCETHNIALEITEEVVTVMESDEERADRLRRKAEAARKAEREAKKKAETKAAKKKAEEERAAKKKAEEEERVAKKRAEEERAAKKKAEEERAAKKKAEEERAAKKRAEEEERAVRRRAEEEARKQQEQAAIKTRRSSIPVPRPSTPPRPSAPTPPMVSAAPPLPPNAPPLPSNAPPLPSNAPPLPPNALPLPPKAKRGF